MRTILHVDMDAFFAAVEQRNRPELKGKPVIVGGRSGGRGVVTTASYEARKFGVHSAMPMAQALRLCPHGVFIKPEKGVYKAESDAIMAIFRSYTPLVEAISIDEAFLDVTGTDKLFGPAEVLARDLQARVQRERDLTCSIGVSSNKFLAKLASDMDKPQGLTLLFPEQMADKVWPLPIAKMLGVGPASLKKMEQLGIHTIGDLAQQSPLDMATHFGKLGPEMLSRAQGRDDRPVVPHTPVKSIGHETTFPRDIQDRAYLETALMSLLEDVCRRMRKKKVLGQTLTVKLRHSDFTTLTRSTSFAEASQSFDDLWPRARDLFFKAYDGQPLRLIGVTLSKLSPENQAGIQLTLFDPPEDSEDGRRLDDVVDQIQEKFGPGKLGRARTLDFQQDKGGPDDPTDT